MDTILSVENAEKYYGKEPNLKKALDRVDFKVGAGEFVSIMGPSGSGKTTLLNCISTIDAIDAGHIYLGSQDLASLPQQKSARFRQENLGFIFQDFNLLDTLSIEENIALITGCGICWICHRFRLTAAPMFCTAPGQVLHRLHII